MDNQKPKQFNWTRDEAILALDLYFQLDGDSPSKGDKRIVELSQLLNSWDIHPPAGRTEKFRNPAGIALKLGNFLALDPNAEGEGMKNVATIDRVVWEEFGHDPVRTHEVALAIRANAPNLTALNTELLDEEEIDAAPEGRILYRTHRARERNRKIVIQKKQQVLKATGTLACEVCGFDFQQVYGDLGAGFMECHHTLPVSQLKPGHRTKVEDLALVCSNCHRMLHRKQLLAVDELRVILETAAM